MRYFKHTERAKITAPTAGNAGYELHTPQDIEIYSLLWSTDMMLNKKWLTISEKIHHLCVIDTEISVEIPEGYVGIICDKSSVGVGNLEKGLNGAVTVLGGIIDSSYRGTIKIGMINLGNNTQRFFAGQKIAQMLIVPCYTLELEEVETLEHLSETERGQHGFGSTGQF